MPIRSAQLPAIRFEEKLHPGQSSAVTAWPIVQTFCLSPSAVVEHGITDRYRNLLSGHQNRVDLRAHSGTSATHHCECNRSSQSGAEVAGRDMADHGNRTHIRWLFHQLRTFRQNLVGIFGEQADKLLSILPNTSRTDSMIACRDSLSFSRQSSSYPYQPVSWTHRCPVRR